MVKEKEKEAEKEEKEAEKEEKEDNQQNKKGFCDFPGCKYRGRNDEEFKNRPICYDDQKGGKGCNKFTCPFKHRDYPNMLTKEMKQKCQHYQSLNNRGAGVLQVEESYEDFETKSTTSSASEEVLLVRRTRAQDGTFIINKE